MAVEHDFENIGVASTGNVDWSVFLQQGAIVYLSIRRYRGVATVNFSELGIDETSSDSFKNFLSEYIRPGQKRLIPPEIEGQLKSIESSARQNLADCSFDCSAFASQGKFVPQSAYRDWKETNLELQSRFFAIRDEFSKDYNKIVEQVRKDYKILAEGLYMQSHPNAKRPSAKYVNAFVDEIISQIPSSDEIVASFEYETVLRRIPDYLLNVISKKHTIDTKTMMIAATNQPGYEPIEKTPKVESEIEKDIADSIESQSDAMVNGFITEILTRLRTMAYEGANQIVMSIERNDGKLVGRASIRAHSLIEDLRKMDFYGDAELQKMVNSLESALSPDNDSPRNVSEIKQAASDLQAWSRQSLDDLGKASQKKAPNKQAKKTTRRDGSKTTAPAAKPRTATKKPTPKTNKNATIKVPRKATGSRRAIKKQN